MERDRKTGRFMPGNKIAVGNKGNREPKWRNRNAVKHGFDSLYKECWIEDEQLHVVNGIRNGEVVVIIFAPGLFSADSDGSITLRQDYAHLFNRNRFLMVSKKEFFSEKRFLKRIKLRKN